MIRHAWTKLKVHNYICNRCGMGKRNANDGDGWYATYHRPDGTVIVAAHVPACEVGKLTEERLEWLRKRNEGGEKHGTL